MLSRIVRTSLGPPPLFRRHPEATAHARRAEGWRAVRTLHPFWFSGNSARTTGRAPQQYQYGIHCNRIQRPGLSADRTSLGVAKRWLMDPCHGGCCNFESWYYRYNTTSSEAPNCFQNQGVEGQEVGVGSRSSDRRQQSEYNLRRDSLPRPHRQAHTHLRSPSPGRINSNRQGPRSLYTTR